MKLILTILVSFICIVSLADETVKKEFPSLGLKVFSFRNTSGDTKISVSGNGFTHISFHKVLFGENCEMKMERMGDELVVEVNNKGVFNSGECTVNFDIKIPKRISLQLRSGSGNFDVKGTKGEIEFKLGSGNVKVQAEVEKLEGIIGSGSVDVSGLQGDVDVKTGSGKIVLKYLSAIEKGRLDIKTGSGTATAFFPPTMKVISQIKSESGNVNNELGESQDAHFIVSMKSGSGDLTIKKLR
ncbi:MAG: DUF4097 family beta strand repeat protein [Bdellovibrionales bacterium]|nr:DUF4097 family beta strand repeat protein [Bdellovibrionales bacterium]